MEPATLLRLSLGTSLVGLLALLALVTVRQPQELEIESIYECGGHEHVRINGTVQRVTARGKTTMITLGHDALIDVLVFDPLKIQPGQQVRVDGRYDPEAGALIADEIMQEK